MAKKYNGIPGGDVPLDFYTGSELKRYIQTAGKTAQSRLKALEKAYGEGGSMAGRQSYVLDRYGKLNVQTKGLSDKALRLKAQQIHEVLAAKSSTIAGVKEIDKERRDTFMANHPNFKVHYKDKTGRERTRKPNKAEWARAMQLMGKIQKAEKGAAYDSNQQLYMATRLAIDESMGLLPDHQEDSVAEDVFLNESGDMLIHSDAFFSAADVRDTYRFIGKEKEE